MSDALIGYSGFVGSTLLKQRPFDFHFRSANIGDMDHGSFDMVVCAAAPGQKWIANREPEADRQKIEDLTAHLATIRCRSFVLISTVDVFKDPVLVDEDAPLPQEGLQAYGLHRRRLEQFIERRFPEHLIIRLPGLVGPGLRKNIIYDLLHDHNVHLIDSRGVFQFYPMVNLWSDIQTALRAQLKLLHLTAEPVSVRDIAESGFGRSLDQTLEKPPVRYDFQTKYAALLGGQGRYHYSQRETLQAIRAYAQSEPLGLPVPDGMVR